MKPIVNLRTLEVSANRFFRRGPIQRRIVIIVDTDYRLSDWLDQEEDPIEFESISAMIEQNGVYGFSCEELNRFGRWERIDSCFGFIGDYQWSSTLQNMKDHMSDEWQEIEPISEFEAEKQERRY